MTRMFASKAKWIAAIVFAIFVAGSLAAGPALAIGTSMKGTGF